MASMGTGLGVGAGVAVGSGVGLAVGWAEAEAVAELAPVPVSLGCPAQPASRPASKLAQSASAWIVDVIFFKVHSSILKIFEQAAFTKFQLPSLFILGAPKVPDEALIQNEKRNIQWIRTTSNLWRK